jgi:dynein heavy chain
MQKKNIEVAYEPI